MKTLSMLITISLFLSACTTYKQPEQVSRIETVNLKGSEIIKSSGSVIYVLDDLVVVSLVGELAINEKSIPVHLGGSTCRSIAQKREGSGFFAFQSGIPIQDAKLVSRNDRLSKQLVAITKLQTVNIGHAIDEKVDSMIQCGAKRNVVVARNFCPNCGGDCKRAACLPPGGGWPRPKVFSDLEMQSFFRFNEQFNEMTQSAHGINNMQ